MSLLLKNRYQILQVLSEAGGFGQTFLAEDTDTPSRRKCVIKKLRPVADEEDFKFVQERFQREAAILEKLGDNCDQIPKLYAYFVENQEFYLVQELIEGLTLKQTLQREGILDENTVSSLLWSLLNVLEYVHAQNIIHRDIKPDNVILRQRDNNPVLIDFGIVKEVLRVGVDGSPTSSVMAGTPGYTALEQAAGRPVYASDLYSLGATAIYLLTGKNPQQMTDLSTGDINWQQFAPQVSSAFTVILNKATESHARDRYKTVSEMREDLQRVLHGEPINFEKPLLTKPEEESVIRPVVPQLLIQQPQKPNYALYFGSVAVVGLLVVIGAITYFSLNNSSRETAQAANTQNLNLTRNGNATTNQSTNLSNAIVANSNINTNANVASIPTPKAPNPNPNEIIENFLKSQKGFRLLSFADTSYDSSYKNVFQATAIGDANKDGYNDLAAIVVHSRSGDKLYSLVCFPGVKGGFSPEPLWLLQDNRSGLVTTDIIKFEGKMLIRAWECFDCDGTFIFRWNGKSYEIDLSVTE